MAKEWWEDDPVAGTGASSDWWGSDPVANAPKKPQGFLDGLKAFGTRFLAEEAAGQEERRKREREATMQRSNTATQSAVARETTGLTDAERLQQEQGAQAQKTYQSSPGGAVADAVGAMPNLARDVAVSGAKGVVGFGESAVGLTDLATGGWSGKLLADLTGYDPEHTKQWLEGWKSERGQADSKGLESSRGFLATLAELGGNPRLMVQQIAESLPGTVGSGAVGGAVANRYASKFLADATAKGLTGEAAQLAVKEAFKANAGTITKAVMLAAAGAEGAQSAGSIAENARQAGRDWKDYVLPAIGAGVGTAAIGYGAGKLATKMGIGDIETDIALRKTGIDSGKTGPGSRVERIGLEATKEALLEEAPQSAQEAGFENVALGRPWDQGIGKSTAQGLAMGFGMGGGHAAFSKQGSGAAPLDSETPTGKPGASSQTPVASGTGGEAPANTQAASGPIQAKADEPTAAEKALLNVSATDPSALDKVAMLDTQAKGVSTRLAELNDPANGYGPMFDGERQDLLGKQGALAAERQELSKAWPKAVTGAPTRFSTEAGAKLDASYSLMEVDDLVTSHDTELRKNPSYPQELQPRERDRAASEMQVSGIAMKIDPARLGVSADAGTGAPIVGADGLVESGNARSIALKRVYQQNGQKAVDYKQFLTDNADQFGLTPEAIAAMNKPVLVRVRTTPVNRAEFARQANASTVAQMAPSEQAKSDANRIDSMEDLAPDDSGDFTNTASRPFIRRFMARLPVTEQSGMVDAAGNLSSTGYTRVRNAVLAKAYGDSPVLARITESMDDNLRNVSRALMLAAPKVAQMRQAVGEGTRFDADITPDLMQAVEELSRLKDGGGSVQDALAQAGMFGDKYSPETRDMLTFLADNARRPRRIADFIIAYMDALDAAGDPNQGSLLGDTSAPGKQDLLRVAERNTQNGPLTGKNENPGGQGAEQRPAASGSSSGNQGNGPAGAGATAKEPWINFPKSSGSLGIPRAQMPQVKSDLRGALVQFLEGRGITHTTEEVDANTLKPTQAEYAPAKVEKHQNTTNRGERSVLVASDGHILDGHHQWMARLEENKPLKVIRFDAPIDKLMAAVFQFPSVHQSGGASIAEPPPHNFKPPALASFMPAELLARATALIEKYAKQADAVQISAEDRAKAEGLLKPLIEKAAAAKPGFDQKILVIVKATDALGQLLAPVKGIKRAAEKLVMDNKFDTGTMRDLLRSTIIVRSYDDAQAVLDEIGRQFTIQRVKNKTDLELNAPNLIVEKSPDDYMDVLVNVVAAGGTVAEIQINIPTMMAVKSGPGHTLYEISRAAQDGSAEKTGSDDLQRELYAAALAAAKNSASVIADQRSGHQVVRDIPVRGDFSSSTNRLPSGNSTYDSSTPSSSVKSMPNRQPSGNLSGTGMESSASAIAPIVSKTGENTNTSAVLEQQRAQAMEDAKAAMADLANIIMDKTGGRTFMVPENTPGLMPTLVKLFDAAIKIVGTDFKKARAWVIAQLKANPSTKTLWNQIAPETYNKAALQALEKQSAQNDTGVADLFGQADNDKNVDARNSQTGDTAQGSLFTPGAGGQRATEPARTGTGGADQQRNRVDDAGGPGKKPVGQTGADGVRGQDENGGRAEPRNRDGDASGVPAGRDIPAKSGLNYAFGDDDLTYAGGWQAKAAQNIEAVELLKQLQADGKQATPEQQKTLAKFIGWGSSEIANTLFGDKLEGLNDQLDNYKQAIENLGNSPHITNANYGKYLPAFKVLQAKNPAQNWYTAGNITKAMLDAAMPDGTTRKWGALRNRLKAALSEAEWAEASRSTQYAHYTSKAVVKSMWKAMERMGFKGGAVLEPGAGIGVFPGLMPTAMANNSIYTGIEFDSITGGILKQLFPDERILVESFVDTKLPKNFYDVAVGNPPFSGIKILGDPEYAKQAMSLHDYFFAKSIDRVKPGGLVVYITSRYTMDKLGDKARAYLGERADLVGAIRLPQTAFQKNAGTEVVTDVIFLRKKVAGETFEQAQPWLKTGEVQTDKGPAIINEYFVAHPEMVLGEHSLQGSMYKKNEYTVLPKPGDIEALFDKAVENLPANIYQAPRGSSAEAAKVREIDFNPKAQKEGNYYLSDAGVLMQREGGVGRRGDDAKSAKDIALLKAFVPLRDALKQAHYDQLNDGDWQTSLSNLQTAYAKFVKAHGQINQFTLKTVKSKAVDADTGETFTNEEQRRSYDLLNKLVDDPDYTLVAALETINEDTGEIKASEFLTKRVLGKPEVVTVKTPMDAMLSVLNDTGKVDIGAIASRLAISEKDAIEALGSAVYQDPEAGWQTSDEYLGGNVKRKLEAAREAAKVDKAFERNVTALEAVQPDPKTPSQINANIGMNWIPGKVYAEFLKDTAGVAAQVQWNDKTKQWIVQELQGGKTDKATADWGTERRNATDLLEHALTGKAVRIESRQGVGAEAKTVFDPVATEAANQKLSALKDEFQRWLWADGKRSDMLVRVFNDKFNTTVPRSFDGTHLTLPGATKTISVFDHVKRGAWRIVQSGNTYLAHAVGSGKTFQMVISAMEQKRLGLIKKPMMVVPNHMLKQFSQEWQMLYPAARLMVADENNFHKDNRRRFSSRVALSDLDGVIITHSAFKLLDLNPEFKQKMINEELAYLRAALEDAEAEDGKGNKRSPRIKQIEKQIENREEKLKDAMSGEGKDKNVMFDELGVDMLYVDEAHEFRKLDFTTARQVKGIQPLGSERARDLYMKARYLEERTPGRSLVLASGTAVTNTLAELYTVQRFMDRQTLIDRGLDDFDSWAAMFGRERTELEPNAAGKYENVTRFSKFVNVPELTQMFRDFADVLTSDTLAALLGDKRPKVEGGSRKIIITPKTDDYAAYQQLLAARVTTSRAWRPSPDEPNNPDPIIKIIGDGRLAAIDMRFVEPKTESNPDSKLNRMLDDVIRVFKETSDQTYNDKKTGQVEPNKGSSMMVFSDLGFGAGVAESRGFNARAWAEKRLRDAGVPMAQVAFMSDKKTSTAKQKLFADVNAGRVRVLFGSSKNMGTGVNAQQRLKALFHLDSPWYPADLEQREGRIIRQGNKNPLVQVFAYAAKGTYDENMWKMLASKQFFIDQAMSGDQNLREIEDLDSQGQYDLAAAMVAEDPRVLQLAGAKADIEKLQRLYQAHERQRAKFKQDFDNAQSTIDWQEARLDKADAEASKVADLSGDKFKALAGGKSFDSRIDWGQALLERFKTLTAKVETQTQTVGEISGFNVAFAGEKVNNDYWSNLILELSEPVTLATTPDTNVLGMTMRATNALAGLAEKPVKMRARIAENRARMDALQGRLDTPFPMAEMLADKIKEANAIEADIVASGKAADAAPDAEPTAEPSLLSRGDGKGMDLKTLQALASRIKAAMSNMPDVVVLDSPRNPETPTGLRSYIEKQGALDDVEGAMHDGRFYLFASGLADETRAEHVLAEHEAAHLGLRAILGDSLKQTMQLLYNNNATVRKAATALQDRGVLTEAEAAEEAIVDIPSAELVKLQGWRKVVLKVRDALAGRGFERTAAKLTGWLDGSLSDQQRADLYVADLVRAARAFVAGKGARSLAEDAAKQEKWLNAEARARGFKDIDDLVDRAYPVFENLAKLWRDKHPAAAMLSRQRITPQSPKDDTALSRAPVATAPNAPLPKLSATQRADDIIQVKVKPSGTLRAVDMAMKGLTTMGPTVAGRKVSVLSATTALYDKAGSLLNRLTPETAKAGLVSDYGVPEAVIDQRALMQGRQRVQLRKAGALIEKLATLTREESRVAYEWMNESDPHKIYTLMHNLPEESVKVLMDVQKMIDGLSQEAVRMGQLTPEAYERNKFAYLRRSYEKFTLNLAPRETAARARAITVLGNQYKGRGLVEAATMKQIQAAAPDWWARKMVAGKADAALKGQKFIRLERNAPSGQGTKPLAGMGAKPMGKLREVHYFPVGENLPAKYADWTQRETFEVRDVQGDKAVLWRDFTPDERERMGEIDEARFAIAKTLHGMIHDVEVGRYLEWLAHNHAKKEGEAGIGRVVDDAERNWGKTFAPDDWVRVPDSKITGTSVHKYGKLAGRYLPGPVWNDLRQTVNGQFQPLGQTYSQVLKAWKVSKTALSPVVHLNNIMSNLVMADWHDVTAGHTAKALRILLGAHGLDGKGGIGKAGNLAANKFGLADREAAREIVNRYTDSGGDIGSWATNEITNDQIAPLLESLEKELAASNGNALQAQVGVMAALQMMREGKVMQAWDAAKGSKPVKGVVQEGKNLIDLYQSEDEVFRLAAWLKAKEEGKTDMAAGKLARKSFMDYSINAPWIAAMRGTAFPFISYSYRAVPMLLETAAHKPHKLLKLMALVGAVSALGSMLAGADDDEERRWLPEEKAGKVWGMVPKMIRMPWNDLNNSPVYLDIRRFIPVGDVMDVGQNHAAIPMLPMLTPGGPLAMMAEVVLNKTGFSGKPITLDTDTGVQKTEKVLDYLYKAFMPNLMGVPGTYATKAVADAADGKTDVFGREQSVGQALLSGVGLKLGSYPTDVLRRNEYAKAAGQTMEINNNIAALKRQLQTHAIDHDTFRSALDQEQEKKRKISQRLAEKSGK